MGELVERGRVDRWRCSSPPVVIYPRRMVDILYIEIEGGRE